MLEPRRLWEMSLGLEVGGTVCIPHGICGIYVARIVRLLVQLFDWLWRMLTVKRLAAEYVYLLHLTHPRQYLRSQTVVCRSLFSRSWRLPVRRAVTEVGMRIGMRIESVVGWKDPKVFGDSLVCFCWRDDLVYDSLVRASDRLTRHRRPSRRRQSSALALGPLELAISAVVEHLLS
jgi:hypothetical protein